MRCLRGRGRRKARYILIKNYIDWSALLSRKGIIISLILCNKNMQNDAAISMKKEFDIWIESMKKIETTKYFRCKGKNILTWIKSKDALDSIKNKRECMIVEIVKTSYITDEGHSYETSLFLQHQYVNFYIWQYHSVEMLWY